MYLFWESCRFARGPRSRSIQRFLELEQYRLLALLPLSDAKCLQARLGDIETRLAGSMRQAAEGELGLLGSRADGRLLAELCSLSAICEEYATTARTRLAASEAYGLVVDGRFDRLELRPVKDTRFIRSLIYKRLQPALRTLDVTADQLKATTEAVARATSLLNTRVSASLVSLGTVLSISALALAVLQTLTFGAGGIRH